jgi:hypothetical protein
MKYKKAVLAALRQMLGAAAEQAVSLVMVRRDQLVLAAVAVHPALAQTLDQVALEELVEAELAVVGLHLTGLIQVLAVLAVLALFVSIHGDPNDK